MHVFEACRTSKRAVDAVNAVRHARVDPPMCHRTREEKREQAEFAGDGLEKAGIMETQAGGKEYPLHVSQAVANTGQPKVRRARSMHVTSRSFIVVTQKSDEEHKWEDCAWHPDQGRRGGSTEGRRQFGLQAFVDLIGFRLELETDVDGGEGRERFQFEAQRKQQRLSEVAAIVGGPRAAD